MNKKILRERRTKFLALLMSLLMVFSLLPIEALAYDCITDGNEQAHYFGSDSRTEEIPATCISPKKVRTYCLNTSTATGEACVGHKDEVVGQEVDKNAHVWGPWYTSNEEFFAAYKVQPENGAVLQPATCVSGTEGRACTLCGKQDIVELSADSDHTPGEWFTNNEEYKEYYGIDFDGVLSPASCTENGTAGSRCTVCNCQLKKTLPAGHDFSIDVPEKAATCMETGYSAHKKCSRCQQPNGDYKVLEIDSNAHVWDEGKVTKAPTCSSKGEKTFTCTLGTLDKNHPTKVEPIDIDPDAHEWDWDNIVYTWAEDNSTCTATVKCKLDSKHTIMKTVNTTRTGNDATCTGAGSYLYTAVFPENSGFANQTKTVEIKAKGHVWGPWFEDAAQFENQYKKPFDGETLKAATCTNAGYHARQCTVCGAQEGKDLDMLEHDFSVEIPAKAATCMEAGYTAHKKCSVCKQPNAEYQELPIDSKAHSWDEGKVTTAPTCSSKGEKLFTCTLNKEHTKKEEIDIDPNAHVWDRENAVYEWAEDYSTCKATMKCKLNPEHTPYTETVKTTRTGNDATCTEAGSYLYTAVFSKDSGLGEQTKTVEIKAKGHQWGPWFNDAGKFKEHYKAEYTGLSTLCPSTCTNAGYHARQCTVCGAQEGKALDMLEHDFSVEIPAKAATCTEAGYSAHKKCSRCQQPNGDYKVLEIDSNAHVWDEGTITKEATCTEKGEKTFTCTLNKEHTKTEEIDINPDAHVWDAGQVTKAATCTVAGEKTFTCTLNKDHTKTEEIAIDANAHVWGNPVYTWWEDNSQVTAARTCTLNETHAETETVQTTATVLEAPTHDAKGRMLYTAEFTHPAFETQTRTVEIPPKGHTLIHHEAIPPTPEQEGRKEYWECPDCGDIFEDEQGEKKTTQEELILPKVVLVYHAQVDPTCTKDGTKEFWAHPQNETKFTAAANGTEVSDSDLRIAALGHNFNNWAVTQAPTLLEKGLEKRVCLRPGCGYEETREIPAKGQIGQQYTVGDLKVEISDLTTCTVTIVGWTGSDEELTLPDEVEILGYNFTVTGIGAGAFAGNEGIKKLILGEKVEVIEKEAFKDCTGLETLNAMHSEKLRVIGESAFEGCEKLATVLLNVTSLEVLEESAFVGVSPEAEFDLFSTDVQELAEAGAMLRTEAVGWQPEMALASYQYYDSSFEKYDLVEEGTLVINEEIVKRP